jgi:hypothetical protein
VKEGNHLTNLLIIYEEFNPTEEIVIGTLKETQERSICDVKALKYSNITAADLSWSDVVFVIRGHLWLTAKLLKQAKRMNRYCIAYWDDDYSDPLPGLVLSPPRKAAFREILFLSDVIVCPNPMLAEKLSKTVGGKRTAVFDTIVKPSEIPEVEPSPTIEPAVVRMVYAAGIGHAMFFDAIIRPVLPALCARYQGKLSITFVGVHPDLSDIQDALSITCVDQLPLEAFRSYMRQQRFDFGIAPLMEGGFFQYKYFNKFLEYASAGIPGIYSNCLPYTLVVDHEVNGLLCDNTPESWLSSMTAMIENRALRERLGACAMDTIQQRFSTAGVLDRLIEAAPAVRDYVAPRCKEPSILWLKIGNVFFLLRDIAFYTMQHIKQDGIIETIKRIAFHLKMRGQSRDSETKI